VVRPKRKKEKELEAADEAARPAPSAPAEEAKGAPEVIEVAGGPPASIQTGPKSLTGGTRV
jgi:hypothetical protein